MGKILINRTGTDFREYTYSFPWGHDTTCYNFKFPNEIIAVNGIENIVDKSNIETLVVGCELTDFNFIAEMVNLRQLYIYFGKGITDLVFLEKLFKLQHVLIGGAHIENLAGLVQLIKEKKVRFENEVDPWKRLEYGMERICVNSDRYSNDGTELLEPGLYISEIIVNQKHF